MAARAEEDGGGGGSGISEEKTRSVLPQRLGGRSTASPAPGFPETMFSLLLSTASFRAGKEMARGSVCFTGS